MDNHTFKSVAFGGFDKQDVAAYIEKISQEYTAQVQELERSRAALQEDSDTLRRQLETLRQKAADQEQQIAGLTAQVSQLTARAAELENADSRAAELAAQVESLRPDAESYRQFRDRVGDIECDARRRAAELENTTKSQLRRSAAEFREQYRLLTAAFDTTSAHVNEELRKIEVNLTQLPRALDQIGVRLQELEGVLKDGEK
ncbi:hypothetical protein [Dysosmobacter sp.]|uniref:hypothetical protein n=1 Tax=Dysosmobacter sp. TaxID=2591382 RepID=UPI002A8BF94C|nr:hypothetical protein [Dysosmobacter sp.]MDY3282544.1 hypothetical protein [Dysosmobacter sp.]